LVLAHRVEHRPWELRRFVVRTVGPLFRVTRRQPLAASRAEHTEPAQPIGPVPA
jgi:hypothetical protein